MSLLTAARQKDSTLGYAPDFVQFAIGPYLADIKRKGIRVISNSGGINPHSCAAAMKVAAKKAGVDVKIATVTGDDMMSMKKKLLAEDVREMRSGAALPKSLHSMNAYLGAGPISRALDLGADIVITGRCVDSALALGPLMHTFKWSADDYNLLAAGSLAGHLIECGAQSTGGIFTDWEQVPDWDNIGFPIVECERDGTFELTKPAKTGGLVTVGTVSEQLVYEIGDPRNYQLPDVSCDFSQVKMVPSTEGVHVSGAKGAAPSNLYKVSATYLDGFRSTAVCTVGGQKSAEKGRRTAEAILKRCRRVFKQLNIPDFLRVHLQILGAEDTYGPHARRLGLAPRESVVWMAVQHEDRKALQLFAREIAPAGTGMAPGLTGIVGGRPKPTPLLKLFSFLYPKNKLEVEVHVGDQKVDVYQPPSFEAATEPQQNDEKVPTAVSLRRGEHTYTLADLALARSGDKGNTCNIGVVARHPNYLPYIRAALTEEAVAEYMSHTFDGGINRNSVTRYDLPGIHALNFVLNESLGGGGIASLRSDPQGKAFAQMLLDFHIHGLPGLDDIKNNNN